MMSLCPALFVLHVEQPRRETSVWFHVHDHVWFGAFDGCIGGWIRDGLCGMEFRVDGVGKVLVGVCMRHVLFLKKKQPFNMRCLRLNAICSGALPNKNNPIARQYCVKASTTLYNDHRVFGTFVAYGKTMEIVKNVENACRICLQDEDTYPGATWDDITVTMFEECPVECSAKVHWNVNVNVANPHS